MYSINYHGFIFKSNPYITKNKVTKEKAKKALSPVIKKKIQVKKINKLSDKELKKIKVLVKKNTKKNKADKPVKKQVRIAVVKKKKIRIPNKPRFQLKRKKKGKPLSAAEIKRRKLRIKSLRKLKKKRADKKKATTTKYKKKVAKVKKTAAQKKEQAKHKKEVAKRKKFEKFLKKFLKKNEDRIYLHGRGAFKRVAGRIWKDYRTTDLEDIERDFWNILLNYTEEGVLTLIDKKGKEIEIDKHDKIQAFIAANAFKFNWFESDYVLGAVLSNINWEKNFFLKIIDHVGNMIYIQDYQEFKARFWKHISYNKDHNLNPFDVHASSNIYMNYITKEYSNGNFMFVYNVDEYEHPLEEMDEPLPTQPIPDKSKAEQPKPIPEKEKPAPSGKKDEESEKQIELKQIELEIAREKGRNLEKINALIDKARADLEKGLITPEIYRSLLENIIK